MMKVTIGIPTFNQKQFLSQAIESALAQDYPELEVIVADDCSSDGTEEIVRNFMHDTRFRYHRNRENLGRVRNYQNLLYNLATGEWYLNLDGDDVLLDSSYISRCAELAVNTKDLVFIYGIRSEVDHDFIFSPARHEPEKNVQCTIWEGKEFFFSVPRMRKNRLNHLTCLYNRKAAMQIHFYRLPIISTDLESLYRLALFGKVGFLNIQAGGWRRHTSNISATVDVQKMIDNYSLFTSVVLFASEIMPQEKRRLQKWFVDGITRKLYTNILTLISAGKWKGIGKLIGSCAVLSRTAVMKVLCNPKLYIKSIAGIVFKDNT